MTDPEAREAATRSVGDYLIRNVTTDELDGITIAARAVVDIVLASLPDTGAGREGLMPDEGLTADIVKFIRWSANVRDDTAEAIAVARALNDRISERLIGEWWDSRAALGAPSTDEVRLDAREWERIETRFRSEESEWAKAGSGMTKAQMTGAAMAFAWLRDPSGGGLQVAVRTVLTDKPSDPRSDRE